MHEDCVSDNFDAKRRNFFGERSRRRASIRLVLVAMPRTGHATVNDAAFAQGSVLMLTDIRDSGNFSVVAKHSDAFSRKRNNGRGIFRNTGNFADFHKTLYGGCRFSCVDLSFLERRRQMQKDDTR